MANFPASLDNATSLPNPNGTDKQNSPDHGALHTSENQAIIAAQTKLGTGATVPAVNTLLLGTGAGTSAWSQATSAQLAASISDETGSGSAVFANTPTLVTPKVDTINEATVSNGVTVGGVNLKSGVVGANSVNTAALQAASVTNAKLSTTAGDPGGSWVVWTPTVTAASGTFTTASGTGRYIQVGKLITYQATLTITTIGTGSGCFFTLPVVGLATAQFGIGTAREDALTGNMGFCKIITSTTASVSRYDNGLITSGGNGTAIKVYGTYEAA
jgi:hypothetical protein